LTTVRILLPTSPFNILNLYFGHQTKWYQKHRPDGLHSQIACAKLLKLFIKYLLLRFRVTHYHLKEVFLIIKFFISLRYPYKHSLDHQRS
jgi:hypothetical protein